ncbi:MAG: hypothetical protein RR232_00685 [Clostridia bacterium]
MAKAQHMTSLHGDELVRKDHPQIVFRGVLDGVTADVAYGAALAMADGNERVMRELNDIGACLMCVMSGHVTGKPFTLPSIDGCDLDQLHDMSHNPQKYFGCYHFIPKPEQGLALAWLNVIRTRVRDAERALVACYPDSCPDESLCHVLNRISSAVFVMMCRENSQFIK